MTQQEEILNMQAGIDMDALVAVKIMGINVKHDWHWKHTTKNYSDDISAAWEVVEKMTEYEVHIMSGLKFKHYPGMPYGAKFENEKFSFVALGVTAPLAICRAALLAVLNA